VTRYQRGVGQRTMTINKGGRPIGSRNLLQRAFIAALVKEFNEHGDAAIRIVRIEEPATFLKLCASVIPRELDVSIVASMADDELENVLETIKRLQQGAPPMLELQAIEESDERH
jgi:hypothetical protein